MLQQYLPLAVLKPWVCAIKSFTFFKLQQYLPLAVLKLYSLRQLINQLTNVATVLTACGIETIDIFNFSNSFYIKLQQYLPLAVLKRLQKASGVAYYTVATVLTACGIETYGIFTQRSK